MNDIQLEPCPFCGKVPRVGFEGDEDGGYGYAECDGPDHFCGSHMHTETEAAAAWNTRALSSPPNVGEGACPMCEHKDMQLAAVSMLVGEDFTESIHAALDRAGSPRQSESGRVTYGIVERIRLVATPPHDRATIRREARQCSVCTAIVAEYPEGMCCHCQELPWPLASLKDPSHAG